MPDSAGYFRGAPVKLLMVLVAFGFAFTAEARAEDTTPPTPPLGLFVEQGETWTSENHFDLWWVNPGGQDAPIAIVHYEVCPVTPSGPCVADQAAGADIDELTLAVPHPGSFVARVWLEDAAGNVDSSQKSPAVALRFDDELPGLSNVLLPDGWLNAADVGEGEFTVEMHSWAFIPLSQIRGYSLTVDGSTPDALVESLATQDYLKYPSEYVLATPPEGITTIKARAVSNSGVVSDDVGEGVLKVDRTPPTVTASGAPDAGTWSRGPVHLELSGSDQAHLSGMAAASPDQPIAGGGHLIHRLDGGPTELVRGGAGSVSVDADGRHTLAFQAVDAAGNSSVEKTVEFKIDRTAPSGVFEHQDPADPRVLSASVHDSVSGISGGWIEYRREGHDGYSRLHTILQDGRLVAALDDEALPAGRYDFRARVTDRAGNEAIIDRARDGSPMALMLPVRLATRVLVAGQPPAKLVCTARRKTSKRRRSGPGRKKRCSAKPQAPVAGKPIRLAYGKRMKSTGRVLTAQGLPVPGAEVIAEAQSRTGGPFTYLSRLTADGRGEFRYVVPAGPSRTIRFRFDGTSTIRPSVGQLLTEVKASVQLRPSRRRLLNGQTVVFRGRLLGKPIPRRGKVIALQAKVGKRWRTFATPRANAGGTFKHRYRFTATTGLRRYVFRAVAAEEDAYPYESGTSRLIKVTVRGR